MRKDTNDLLTLLGCLSLPLVMVISAVWGGLVLSTVWNWFMPLIFGLPHLNIVQAIAVMTIVSYLTKANVSDLAARDDDPQSRFFMALVKAFLTPLFFLAIAFIIRLFM